MGFHEGMDRQTKLELTVSCTLSLWERRKRFRQIARNSPRVPFAVDERKRGSIFSSGLLDLVADETIVSIFEHLLRLPPTTCKTNGHDLRNGVLRTVQAVSAFACTCKRFNTVLCTLATAVRQEMLARISTHIVPAGMGGDSGKPDERPYSTQLRVESRSSDQLTLLRVAIDGLCTHCGGNHCRKLRIGLNRDLRKRVIGPPRPAAVLSASADHVRVLAASADGTASFAAVRRYEHGKRREPPRTRQLIEELVRIETGGTTTPEGTLFSSITTHRTEELPTWPESLCTNSGGTRVAAITLSDDLAALPTEPHARLFVWSPTCKEVGPWKSGVIQIHPGLAVSAFGIINPQAAWWVDDEGDDDGEQMLAVLWSSSYVHPMGTTVGENAEERQYALEFYNVDNLYDAAGGPGPDYYNGPYPGKPVMARPRADGREVAVVVESRCPFQGTRRLTFLHHFNHEVPIGVHHSPGMGGMPAVGPNGIVPGLLSPAAVALSPTGDCLVAVHRGHGHVTLEVLVRRSAAFFASTHTLNVTHHVWDPSDTADAQQTLDNHNHNEHAASPSWLHIPYDVTFSPCGRFAVIVDQRPRWRVSISNHALIVVDMALRHEPRGVRALPLASVDDVAPRAVQWTERGIWVAARHGALMLHAA